MNKISGLLGVFLVLLGAAAHAGFSASSVHYEYDAAYNRTYEIVQDNNGNVLEERRYHYDTAGRLSSIENLRDATKTETFGYDGNGNQISRTVNGVTYEYEFDARDQLIRVEEGGPNSPPAEKASYRYNADGMRTDLTEQGAHSRLTWDDDDLILVKEPDNTTTRYQWGPGRLANVVSTRNGTTQRDWYLYDALSTVNALINENGSVTVTYNFDAFGELLKQTGNSNSRFGFTNHQYDSLTKLHFFKARYYSPDQGRFIGEDSYEGDRFVPESLNGYIYAHANPTVYIDPDGHIAFLANGRDTLLKFDGWLAGQVSQYNDGVLGTIGMASTTVTRGLAQGGAGLLSLANTASNTISTGLGSVGLNSTENTQAHWNELRQSGEIASTLTKDIAQGGDSKVYQKARETVSYAYEGDKRALSDVGATAIGLIGGGQAVAPQKMSAASRATAQATKKISSIAQSAVQKTAEKVRQVATDLKTKANQVAEQRARATKAQQLPDEASSTSVVRAEASDAPEVVEVAQNGPSRPGGYITHDVDSHGKLSPQVNRAEGHTNTKADDYVQSHHPVQDKWAEINVKGYDRDAAPSILLESASGKSHAKISAAQRAVRRKMKNEGKDPWSNDINTEFQLGYRQMIEAGVPQGAARKAIKDSYKYFDSLEAFK